jgi:BNR repeat-like domain
MVRGLAAAVVAAALIFATGAAAAPQPSFTITPLLRPDGSSETAISYNASGLAAMTALSWTTFGTNTWLGPFGSTPSFVGQFDANLAPGVGGGGDADVDLGSTGTLHLTSLIFFFNPATKITQLGVSAVTCPNANVANNFGSCKSQIIDTTQADRQWITSRGSQVWIAYHDSGSSTTVHVQRSDDDGFTWKRVGDPITGNGPTTGGSTFNNENGPIVADPSSNVLYDVYAYGTASVQKGTSADFNNVAVARSMDGGVTWTTTTVFSAPRGSVEDNVFPSLAVDPANGDVYATWSDQAHVYVSKSTDHGATWSAALSVTSAPVGTAVFPWVAARNGTVDVVYYGTNVVGNSNTETGAAWNVYLAQSTNGGVAFTQTQVTSSPNHVGVICTGGISCKSGTRNLLDLFEIAIDPKNGKAGIIYTDDTLTKDSSGNPLPQAVLAQQN